MKRFLAFLTASVLALSLLVGCSAKGNGNGSDSAAKLPGSLSDIMDAIYKEQECPLDVTTEDVDLTDEWTLSSFTGLTDASEVKEAVASEPMISSIAYSLVVVRVADANKAPDIAKEMIDGINPRKWVCVEADDIQAVSYDDVVLLFMVDSELGYSSETVVNAFASAYQIKEFSAQYSK